MKQERKTPAIGEAAAGEWKRWSKYREEISRKKESGNKKTKEETE